VVEAEEEEAAKSAFVEFKENILQTAGELKTDTQEFGSKIIRTALLFLNKVVNLTNGVSEVASDKLQGTYKRFRELLEEYNPGVLTQEGFEQLTAYLKAQVDNIITCGSFALAEMLGVANDFRIAATTIIIDILYGILLPTTQDILKTSLFALKKAAERLRNATLYALNVTIGELKDIILPVIAFIQDSHYVVITKVTERQYPNSLRNGRVWSFQR
jgi:hypothetical protein